jgi:very-short-patch-repair endonuclease
MHNIKHSLETRKKLSLIKKKMYKEGKIKLPLQIGYHHTEDTKKIIGLGAKKGIKPFNYGKIMTKEDYPNWGWRTSRKNQIFPLKDSLIEIKIQNFLKALNIEFFAHNYMNINHAYQCDIFIPSMNLVIECDGKYWHNYPVGRDIDKIRTSELIGKGFKVLRLWEDEIKTMDLNCFKEVLYG